MLLIQQIINILAIVNILAVRGGLKSKVQRKVSLAAEDHRVGQRSNTSVWKSLNDCACQWLPRPQPKSLMEKKAAFMNYNIV